MERHIKERLVGAAVLMAAAIILIPEMLSGPHRGGDEAGPPASGDVPLKTYTIDLNESAATPQTEATDNRAPPPEEVIADPVATTQTPPATQANPEPRVNPPVPAVSVAPTPPPSASPAPSSEPPPARAPAPARVAPPVSTPRVPTSGAWAVQLGSFSKLATAEGMVRELRAQGHAAFVMSVTSGAATLYRVRIGPMQDRAGAEAVLLKVKPTASAATVVVHP